MRVVLDTNVIVSALVFGGKPKRALERVIDMSVDAVVSPCLVSEYLEILAKKFHLSQADLLLFEQNLQERFGMVQPRRTVHVFPDEADNRVLEAAIEGSADVIVTGDSLLLKKKRYGRIRIVSVEQFLRETSE